LQQIERHMVGVGDAGELQHWVPPGTTKGAPGWRVE